MTEATALTTDTTNVEATTQTTAPDFTAFTSSAPKELQELFTKNGVKDFDTLNKSYSGLNSLIGKKGLIKPEEGASEAEVKAYQEKLYQEMGVPTDKYEYTLPDTIPEEAISKEFIANLETKAKANGVSNKAFQEIMTDVYTAYGEMLNASKPDLSGLQKEWGKDADTNIKVANAFYKNYMQNDPNADASAKKFGNDPDFLKFTYNMARKMGEDRLDASHVNSNLSPDTVHAEAKALAAEAVKLHKAGDWKGAQTANEKAKEKYAQHTLLTNG